MDSRVPTVTRPRVTPLSGRKARRFRARWAACAKRTEETIRTIKLPMEVPDGQRIDSQAFAELHATLRESGPGTLVWLLLTVHSLGFRIFSKSDEVTGFLNAGRVDNDAYRAALRAATGVSCQNLDPVHLYLRFRSVPRPSRGTTLAFTPENIGREYTRYFNGGNAAHADPALASLMADLAGKLGLLSGWTAVASDPARAFEAWDDVLRTRGVAVPALGPSMRGLVFPPRAVATATIAHDRSKPRVPLDARNALQLLVAGALSEARREGLTETPALTRRVQQLILTDKYSGLSWLWGSGLRLLKGATIAECRSWFGVGADVAAELLLAAKSIPSDRVFGSDGYAAYRADVGGGLANWIRQYIAAMAKLDCELSRPPESESLASAMQADEFQRIAMRAGTSTDELNAAAEAVHDEFGMARKALDRMMGRGAAPSAGDIDAIEQYSQLTEGLHRLLSCVAARVKIEKERAAMCGDGEAIVALGACEFGIPRWCFPLPRLNQMSRSPDPLAQAQAAAAGLVALGDIMNAHARRIAAWCGRSGIPVLPFDRLAQGQRRFLLENGAKASGDDALLLAVGQILDRFGRVARGQPAYVARRIMDVYGELGIFLRKEDLHRYFLSRQGTLRKRPFDRGIRLAFPIDTSVLTRLDKLLPPIGRVLQVLRREVLADLCRWKDLSAVLELERAYHSILLSGLPDILPSAIAKPAPEPEFQIPLMLERQLQAPTVSSRVVKQVFNLYAAKLREVTAVLARRRFFVRHTFTRSRDNSLIYVPKNVSWRPPARLRWTRKPIGVAHKVMGCWNADVVNPRDVLARAAQALDAQPGVRDWLVQSPHDWCYAGVRGGGVVRGLTMSKAGTAKRPAEHRDAFRLVGPSSMKTSLDQALLQRRAAIGDLQVICERHFVQDIERDEQGANRVTVRETKCSLTLGIPLRESSERFGDPISMDRYLCVDLGEYGLGWTAFETKTHREVASGFEPVASLRSFAKHLKAGRRPREREARLGARFERGMENARKRVAGEIVHTIDSLLSKFRAFPVLEVRPRRPSQGGEDIVRVHDLVVETYAFVDKDHAARRRRAHWAGSSIWMHPYLLCRDAESGGGKALNLFPGTVVAANGNSQTCSCCGRNAIETVRGMASLRATIAFKVTEHGKVELPNGTIVLHRKSPDKAKREAHRRKGEHAPRDTACGPGSISAQGLIAAIKDNIRQPPLRKSASTSSHSRYFCVYADCAALEHADVNAARNIGRRFRERLFDGARQKDEDGVAADAIQW